MPCCRGIAERWDRGYMGGALTGLGLLLAAGSAVMGSAAGAWTREPLTGLILGIILAVVGLISWAD